MLARYYRLEKYSDESFRDFVRALSDLYKMGQIRISPHQGARLFGAFQRKHLCPGWDIRHPKGFLAVWARHRSVVRTVTFILFRANGSPRVEMTVDLERNILSLDQADGIDPEEVSSVLRWNFNIREVTFLESARMTTLVTLVIAATIVGMVLVFVVLGFFFHWLDSVSAKNSGIQTEPNRSDELVEKTKAVIGTISNIAHGASAFEISLFLLGVLAFPFSSFSSLGEGTRSEKTAAPFRKSRRKRISNCRRRYLTRRAFNRKSLQNRKRYGGRIRCGALF